MYCVSSLLRFLLKCLLAHCFLNHCSTYLDQLVALQDASNVGGAAFADADDKDALVPHTPRPVGGVKCGGKEASKVAHDSYLIHPPILFILLSYSSSYLIHPPILFILLSYSSSYLIHPSTAMTCG